jgi:branched-subunit amino acid ABC-type transport system permease component
MAEAAQLAVNGLMAGGLLMLPAIGFSLIYGVLRFPNFAVASIATIGGFSAYVANVLLHWPLPAAIAFAFLVAGLIGVGSDYLLLRPLRKAGIVAAAIGSLALNIFLENVVRFSFGNDLRGLNVPIMRDVIVFGLHVGRQQAFNIAWAATAAIVLFLLLRYSRIGKQMRAVADNPVLARIHRIDALLVGNVTTFIAMGLAGIGGSLLALDTSVDPLLGFRILLPLFAACVLGGIGSFPGALLGAAIIGIGEEMAAALWSPAYRTGVGFIAIVITLMIRPSGIFSRQ